MKRLSREAIRTRISLALTVLRPYQKRELGLLAKGAHRDVVEDLTTRIMGRPESEAVILVPSLTGDPHSPRHGRWGEDEPHPHPDMPFADH